MRRGLVKVALFVVVAGVLSLCSASLYAQSPVAKALAVKAHNLEQQNRPDLAAQTWKQILLAEPKNAEALAGLARDSKLMGKDSDSNTYLDKLRAVNPSDPEIGRIQALQSYAHRDKRLAQATDLAKTGRYDEAMQIYRDAYGNNPPDGDIALAYYQTLYSASGGKPQAIEGLRGLSRRFPTDTRFAVALGQMLTYDPRTREEGVRILKQHPNSPDARNALRQALVWGASPGTMMDYYKLHPNDAEIGGKVKQKEEQDRQVARGRALSLAGKANAEKGKEEKAAYDALNANNFEDAQERFEAILQRDPENAHAMAGIGFLRMKQDNFGGAISYLEQAMQNGDHDRAVVSALETSRFWFTMEDATAALDAGRTQDALDRYNQALRLRPSSPEALEGLAGAQLQFHKYTDAEGTYQHWVKVQPASAPAWRGLFMAEALGGFPKAALNTSTRLPAAVRAALARDPAYLSTLASVYTATGRTVDASRTLALALSLPFPDEGANLKNDTRMQYAGILMEAKRYSQAATLYRQVLAEDSTSLSAWTGLVYAQHQNGQDPEAIATVEQMPPTTYDAALKDTGFLSMMAAIYDQQNQLEVAQGFLERSAHLMRDQGKPIPSATQLQLASLYLRRNQNDQAFAIYREVLTRDPAQYDAWKALLGTLQKTDHTQQALLQIDQIPPAVRKHLEGDFEYQQLVAGIYAANGRYTDALALITRVNAYYANQHMRPPSEVEVQNAWLLYNTKNDRALYPALMQLGSREDLTVPQKLQIQQIWASWSIRRATTALDNGHTDRAITILDAARQAFPDNPEVQMSVAGGYLRAGVPKAALVIFKAQDLGSATAADYRGAIGAALSGGDKGQAEIWLRQALEVYPHDAEILGLAAKYEQSRGDNLRAAEFYKASLAAMPEVNPTDRLAHTLVTPDPVRIEKRPATPGDLAVLMNPNLDEGPNGPAKNIKVIQLPSYGTDPYYGKAPVILNGQKQRTTVVTETTTTVDSSTQIQIPTGQGNYTTTTIHHPRRKTPASSTTPQSNTPKPSSNVIGPIITTPDGTMETAPTVRDHPVTMPMPYRPGNRNMTGQMAIPKNEEHIKPPSNRPLTVHSVEYSSPVRDEIGDGLASLSAQNQQQAPAPRRSSARASTAQNYLNDQVDPQLLPSEPAIRYLPNAPVSNSLQVGGYSPQSNGTYQSAQYTPTPQDAAQGAYSAGQLPRQQQPVTPQQAPPQAPQLQTKPSAQQPTNQPALSGTKKTRRSSSKTQQNTRTVPTLVTAPSDQPVVTTTTATDTETVAPGLTDDQLIQRNLPPLRGRWVKVRPTKPLDPREEAELQLATIESGYSGWLGGSGYISHRSGDPGFDSLTALSAPFEASGVLGGHVRFTFVAEPVFLDSGQADGNSQVTVISNTKAYIIPQILGTYCSGGVSGGIACTSTTATPPNQQNASGMSGELQATSANFGVAVGYSTAGFLVSNFTGRFQWRPFGGPVNLSFVRESVKDSQLSWAGLRNPASASLSYDGDIWGGVVANEGNIQFARGDLNSGYYIGLGGQYITGHHVETNTRFDGSMGAYWRVLAYPEYGSLNVGANFFGMHYEYNERAFTYGLGGYYSPEAYFLANVPVTWNGHYGMKFHYNILGSLGLQAFQEDSNKLFPLDLGTQTGFGNLQLPFKTSVGANYDLRGQWAYSLNENWFVGGTLSANNSRDYTSVNLGFFVRYMFRPQHPTTLGPTGLFPMTGFRPFLVP
jgi:tetratricopeptide (TPR) repeat protein